MRKNIAPRYCEECRKKFYPTGNNQKFCRKKCQEVHEAKHINKDRKHEANLKHKEKSRHGNGKERLVAQYGLVCSKCGKTGDSFEITGHHTTGDKNEHEYQELLCRSCHAKAHDLGQYKIKIVDKESIQKAIADSKGLDEAAAKLGISRSFLRKQRIHYGLYDQPCKKCGRIYPKSEECRKYCPECTAGMKKGHYNKFYLTS